MSIFERIIKASCPENGLVFDPFMGSGTTAVACLNTNRQFTGFEINKEYHQICLNRIENISKTKKSDLFSNTKKLSKAEVIEKRGMPAPSRGNEKRNFEKNGNQKGKKYFLKKT